MTPEMEKQILEDAVWPRTYTQLMIARRLAERPVPITSAEWTLLAEGWIEEDELARSGERRV